MRLYRKSLLATVVVALTACSDLAQASYAGIPARLHLPPRQDGASVSVSATGAATGASASAFVPVASSSMPGASTSPTPPSPPLVAMDNPVKPGFMLYIINHFSYPIYVHFQAQVPGLGGREGLLKPPQPGSTTESCVMWSPGINSTVPDLAWTIPANSSGQMMLPMEITSGRVYLSKEKLPFPVNAGEATFSAPTVANVDRPEQNMTWGFVELSHHEPPAAGPVARAQANEPGIWANPSFVDFVGMQLGISVKPKQGPAKITRGLMPEAVPKICEALAEHADKPGNDKTQAWWKKLCILKDGQPHRIMSPNLYRDMTKNRPDGSPKELLDYYEPYINRVWHEYNNKDLDINLQIKADNDLSNGNLCKCNTANPANMSCNCRGLKEWTLPRPTSTDIFGCNSGTFDPGNDNVTDTDNIKSYALLRPRLCAGFVRSTLLLNTTSPSMLVGPDKYYTDEITDYYSKIVHENVYDSRGYTFSFDDVDPVAGEHNSAGLIKETYVQSMNIVAGGWQEGDESEPGQEGSSAGASPPGASSSAIASSSMMASSSSLPSAFATAPLAVPASSGAATP